MTAWLQRLTPTQFALLEWAVVSVASAGAVLGGTWLVNQYGWWSIPILILAWVAFLAATIRAVEKQKRRQWLADEYGPDGT